ncbi:hypothetical protein FXO38_22427 [Capsicum annuum]|nr:hypothetical protein FXO37_35057 [Capsicum annuum]KAF3639836.1 hypothetical protein FXO38_22427 [Capsicum annuum]
MTPMEDKLRGSLPPLKMGRLTLIELITTSLSYLGGRFLVGPIDQLFLDALGIPFDPYVFLSSLLPSYKYHHRLHTLHVPLNHILLHGRVGFGEVELGKEEFDMVEVEAFG